MPEPSTDSGWFHRDDERSRTLQLLFVAVIGSPWLLLLEPAREVTHPAVTATAVVLGGLCGVGVIVGLADVDASELDDTLAAVGTLLAIAVGTVVVWVAVPSSYLGAVVQFAIAFTWAAVATQALRYRIGETSQRIG